MDQNEYGQQEISNAEKLFYKLNRRYFSTDEHKIAKLLAISLYRKMIDGRFCFCPDVKLVNFMEWRNFIDKNFTKSEIKFSQIHEQKVAIVTDNAPFFNFISSYSDAEKNENVKDFPEKILVFGEKDIIEAELLKRSHVIFCQRVEKTPKNKHGFQYVSDIPVCEPAVLFLGGTGTDSNRAANGQLSIMETFLEKNGVREKVNIYATIYNFGKTDDDESAFDSGIARKKMFQDHFVPSGSPRFKVEGNNYVEYDENGLKIKETPFCEETFQTRYIDELFENAFLLRICDKAGKKLPIQEACKRMRKLTVCAHCHGGYTFLKVEEKLQQKMRELGFSKDECAKIQKELLCIVCAPDTPLGISKSTMISFISSKDHMLSHNNNFRKEIYQMQEIKSCYFSKKQGELFLGSKFFVVHDPVSEEPGEMLYKKEHQFLTYKHEDELTQEGKNFLSFISNAIGNGVKSSLKNTPLPSIEDLVCGQDENNKKIFNQLKENGCELWSKIAQNTKMRLIKIQNYQRD